MSEMRTEEEQVQALKNWWSENGKSLLIAIVAALAIVGGWNTWQNTQQAKLESASAIYQNLVDAVSKVSQDVTDEAQVSTAYHLAEQLKSEFAATSYSRLAALLVARVAVDSDNLDQAIKELDWVLANEPTEVQTVLATLRKARIVSAQGKHDEALSLISKLNLTGFTPQIKETKGDILLLKGEYSKARTAYQAALTATGDEGNAPLLKMKVDNLAGKE